MLLSVDYTARDTPAHPSASCSSPSLRPTTRSLQRLPFFGPHNVDQRVQFVCIFLDASSGGIKIAKSSRVEIIIPRLVPGRVNEMIYSRRVNFGGRKSDGDVAYLLQRIYINKVDWETVSIGGTIGEGETVLFDFLTDHRCKINHASKVLRIH